VTDINPSMEANDTERFDALFAEHRRLVLAYALRRSAGAADAADAVAETFLTAWRRLDDVPPGEDARAWLLGVTRRVLANQRRGAGRRTALAGRLAEELSTQLAELAPPSDTDLAVREALGGLSEADREVLLLAAWEGLEPGEIAEVLGVRAVTVRSRLHRARRRLQDRLEALGCDPGRSRTHTDVSIAKEPTA
jgi:RNA polymerase sigma-70 factor (ECF subfamily)